ncbi:ABC transporter substrate-binding protein, partial [Klebsiella michiganensis]
MRNGLLALTLLSLSAASQAAIDLRANEQPLPVTRDELAIAKIPANYVFVEPGTLTVAIS